MRKGLNYDNTNENNIRIFLYCLIKWKITKILTLKQMVTK